MSSRDAGQLLVRHPARLSWPRGASDLGGSTVLAMYYVLTHPAGSAKAF
jgi:hypothetical protein